MSLRIFHIVFIVVCILLTLFVGVWGIHEYVSARSTLALGMAIVFILGGVVLVAYGSQTFRKLKELP
jgi:DNA-binding transcriptional regulator of glucitol operon